jgi:hypothetical protein
VAEPISYLKLAREARAQGQAGQAAEQERRNAYEATYRATLRRLFALAALGHQADPRECDRALDTLGPLIDTIGVKLADQIRCEEKARWLVETGRCPYCGGAPHD